MLLSFDPLSMDLDPCGFKMSTFMVKNPSGIFTTNGIIFHHARATRPRALKMRAGLNEHICDPPP